MKELLNESSSAYVSLSVAMVVMVDAGSENWNPPANRNSSLTGVFDGQRSRAMKNYGQEGKIKYPQAGRRNEREPGTADTFLQLSKDMFPSFLPFCTIIIIIILAAAEAAASLLGRGGEEEDDFWDSDRPTMVLFMALPKEVNLLTASPTTDRPTDPQRPRAAYRALKCDRQRTE